MNSADVLPRPHETVICQLECPRCQRSFEVFQPDAEDIAELLAQALSPEPPPRSAVRTTTRDRVAQAGNVAGPSCPEHGANKPSHFGGLYCPTRLANGNWCTWTDPPRKRAAS